MDIPIGVVFIASNFLLTVYKCMVKEWTGLTFRAMNAHTIYERFKKNKSSIHGSYRLPGNPLDIYDNLVNDGIVSFRDGKLHRCDTELQTLRAMWVR